MFLHCARPQHKNSFGPDHKVPCTNSIKLCGPDRSLTNCSVVNKFTGLNYYKYVYKRDRVRFFKSKNQILDIDSHNLGNDLILTNLVVPSKTGPLFMVTEVGVAPQPTCSRDTTCGPSSLTQKATIVCYLRLRSHEL